MKTYKKLLITLAGTAAAATLLTGGAMAATSGGATVTASALNMRTGSSTDYNIITVAPRGTAVVVEADAGNGWYQVLYNGSEGYMCAQYLSFSETVAADLGTGTIQGTYVRFRSGPSLSSSVLDYFQTGMELTINGVSGAWYEVVYNGTVGYVSSDYLVPGASDSYASDSSTSDTSSGTTDTGTAATTDTSTDTSTDTATSAETTTSYGSSGTSTEAGQLIVDTAMKYLGISYVWGGTSPDYGFDCSGLVYYVYGECGYSINRVAQSMYYNGVDVDLNDLQPGDILCFGSSVYNIWHVGIYIGNNQFIHSPYSGQVVSIETLDGSYGGRLVAARRIV